MNDDAGCVGIKTTVDQYNKLKIEHHQLQDECRRLRKEIGCLDSVETLLHRIALKSNHYHSLQNEENGIKRETVKLLDEVNVLETLVQKQIKPHKDLKASIEAFKTSRDCYQPSTKDLDLLIAALQKKTAELRESVAKASEHSKAQLAKAEEDGEASLTGLHTQLKILETKKRTIQNQTNQRIEQNAELTKICDDLLSQSAAGNSA